MFENDPLTEKVLGCAFKVSNTLGPGFLEKVYENAMALELDRAGISFERQKAIDVWYEGTIIGKFVADLLVEGSLLVELKAVKALEDSHLAQGLNYLRATALETCLLLNFGSPKLEIRRLKPSPSWPKLILGEPRS
ncbi:MAG: GxxExxY protein [Acidobacteria bacterium]|nr:GxxExxY protein [Acidobacteriota bacterium]